jgi:excisionase family DNA binding protein
MERRTYTVAEAAIVLGISRTSAYERVHAGELPALRLGRRIVIARHALEELLGAPLPAQRMQGVVRTVACEEQRGVPGSPR